MFKKILCLMLALCLLTPVGALAAEGSYELKTSEACIKMIKGYESFCPTAYSDGGGWAIGYGTHIDPGDYPNGISEDDADTLMRRYLYYMEQRLDAMTDTLGITLSQNQYDALASFTYNIGAGWMVKGNGLYDMLAYGIDSFSADRIIQTFAMYCHAGSVLMVRIAQRRIDEGNMFVYGDYHFGGTPAYEIKKVDDPDADTDVDFNLTGELTGCVFSDVYYTSWYYKYVSPLTCLGIISGVGNGQFAPLRSVTCGEALKLILLAAGYPAQSQDCVPWSLNYLQLAYNKGVITDRELTAEFLDEPIDRGMVAKIAARAMGLSESSSASPFGDTGDGYATALYEAGIITGSADANGALVYLPRNDLTRAEISAIIWRIRCA